MKMIAINKHTSKLKSWSVEMPTAPFLNRSLKAKQQTLSVNSTSQKQQTSANSKNKLSETLHPNFNLSWSHYLNLMRMDDKNERKFYEIEAVKNNWSIRELKRQFDSALFITSP